ncbi:hypothetical protein BDV25DRAFT_167686 [Aspergillus avenaceus]|uniref:Uncharacterized protein n=1 Tax=Aspergillus avenaceus TaxID=36643 RepID=A0A5N6TCH8_ASPAV|nr:hypothetical protein BDV25DRAFT_167686 [Aspergillus avenaceus]
MHTVTLLNCRVLFVSLPTIISSRVPFFLLLFPLLFSFLSVSSGLRVLPSISF